MGYHRFNQDRFTPLAMIAEAPQFDMPIECATDVVWKDILDHMNPGVTARDVFSKAYKGAYIWCGKSIGCPNQFFMCNSTWNSLTKGRYCATEAAFNRTTVAQLHDTQKWDESLPEFGEGLAKLWYTSRNMLEYHPKSFHIYAHDAPSQRNFMHHPMWVQMFAEYAD